MTDRDKKVEALKQRLQKLVEQPASRVTADVLDLVSDETSVPEDHNDKQACVRAFYEEVPYHKTPPRHSLEARVANLQDDWAKWSTPVTMDQRRTLDAGCGCGYNLVLHGALSAVTVGVDVSLEALNKAAAYIAENSMHDNIALIRSDIRELPLPDASFDIITCVGVLHHIPDHVGALGKMAKLLDQDGLLLLGIYHPLGRLRHKIKNRFLDILAGETLEKRIRWARRLFSVRKEAEKYDIPPQIYLRDAYAAPYENAFSVKYLTQLTEDMGLRLIEVRPSPSKEFTGSIAKKASFTSNGGMPLDAPAIDRALARMRQHHYWCLLKKA